MSSRCVISAHIPKVERMPGNNTPKKRNSIKNGFQKKASDSLPKFETLTPEKMISQSNNPGTSYNSLYFDVDTQVG